METYLSLAVVGLAIAVVGLTVTVWQMRAVINAHERHLVALDKTASAQSRHLHAQGEFLVLLNKEVQR